MTDEKYEAGSTLKWRISDLEMMKKYLSSFMKVQPIRITLTTEIFNEISTRSYDSSAKMVGTVPVQRKMAGDGRSMYWENDAACILEAIDNRIAQLQKEFENL